MYIVYALFTFEAGFLIAHQLVNEGRFWTSKTECLIWRHHASVLNPKPSCVSKLTLEKDLLKHTSTLSYLKTIE